MKTVKRQGGREGQQPYMLCVDEQALQGASFEPSLSLKLSQYSAQPLKHKGFERRVPNLKQAVKPAKTLTTELEELAEEKPRSKSRKMRPEDMGLKKKQVQANRRKPRLADSKSPKSKVCKKIPPESSLSTTLLELDHPSLGKHPIKPAVSRQQKQTQILNESIEQRYLELLHKYKSLRTRAVREETVGRQHEKSEITQIQQLQEDLKRALDEQKQLGQKVLEIEEQWKEERRKAIDDGKEKLRQKELQYKNQELGLQLRLQELQGELNIMLQKSSLSEPINPSRLEVVPATSSPLKLESFYSRRESRPTDAIKSGISKSVTQPQPRWMNSETLTTSYLPVQQSNNLGSLQKASTGTKSVKRVSTVSQPQNLQRTNSVAVLKVNPVKQLEKVLEQVATDYKKIQQDNRIVKQKLETIQSAILRLEANVSCTDKTARTAGNRSVSELAVKKSAKMVSQKSVRKIDRNQAVSTSALASAEAQHGISAISGGFAELDDSQSVISPSGRTSNLKKHWVVKQLQKPSPAKTAPKDLNTKQHQHPKKLQTQKDAPSPSFTPIHTNLHGVGTWTGQYQSLLHEIHSMRKQISLLAEENEDMAILLTDKSVDEPTQNMYDSANNQFSSTWKEQPMSKPSKTKLTDASKLHKPANAQVSHQSNPIMKNECENESEQESIIEANLEEDFDMEDESLNPESASSGEDYEEPVRSEDQADLDDTEFYHH